MRRGDVAQPAGAGLAEQPVAKKSGLNVRADGMMMWLTLTTTSNFITPPPPPPPPLSNFSSPQALKNKVVHNASSLSYTY